MKTFQLNTITNNHAAIEDSNLSDIRTLCKPRVTEAMTGASVTVVKAINLHLTTTSSSNEDTTMVMTALANSRWLLYRLGKTINSNTVGVNRREASNSITISLRGAIQTIEEVGFPTIKSTLVTVVINQMGATFKSSSHMTSISQVALNTSKTINLTHLIANSGEVLLVRMVVPDHNSTSTTSSLLTIMPASTCSITKHRNSNNSNSSPDIHIPSTMIEKTLMTNNTRLNNSLLNVIATITIATTTTDEDDPLPSIISNIISLSIKELLI